MKKQNVNAISFERVFLTLLQALTLVLRLIEDEPTSAISKPIDTANI